MKKLYHKIRGSHPGYIGIEVPDETDVVLLDEENFNLYRRAADYNGTKIEINNHYGHFLKPTEGSWHIVIEGKSPNFRPDSIHIIYKAA
jgi:hypothetical protein